MKGILDFFRKRGVAIGLTALVVLGCLVYGFTRPRETPAPVPEAAVAELTPARSVAAPVDAAGILSADTAQKLQQYNIGWDRSYHSVIAVATVHGTGGKDLEDFSIDYGTSMGLGGDDMLLLIDADAKDSFFVVSSSEIIPDGPLENAYNSFEDGFARGDTDSAILKLFQEADGLYNKYAPVAASTASSGSSTAQSSSGYTLVGFLLVAILVFWVLGIVDRLRYRSWQSGARTAAFAPLLFWHRPGSSWYRRMGGQTYRSGVNPGHNPPRAPTGSFGSRGGYGGRSSSASSFGSRGGFGVRSSGSSFGSRGGFGGRK